MADIPPPIAAAAQQLADMSQRISVQIAEQPLELREEAFVLAERTLREVGLQLGIANERLDGLVELLMKGMRQFVLDIDVGGSPQGGNA